MKIRKSILSRIAWIGIILCVLVAGFILGTPHIANTKALIPAAVFVLCAFLLNKANEKPKKSKKKEVSEENQEDDEEDDEEETKANWPLRICLVLLVLAIIGTVRCFWWSLGWFMVHGAILFGVLIWLAVLLSWKKFWIQIFAVAAAIILALSGFYGIQLLVFDDENQMETLYVDNLYVDSAKVEYSEVTEENVEMQKVENAEATNQTVTNQTVTNQVTESETVTTQVVENQTVTNQTVTNQTVGGQTTTPEPTEPEETEPEATEPEATKPTEPKPTEPKPTEPVHKHSYKSVVTAPTCVEQGYTTYTCACGHSYKDSYKGALGHSYKSTVVAPTASAGGYTEHKCERCGHTYKDAFTDKVVSTPKLSQKTTLKYGTPAKVSFEGISYDALRIHNSALAQMNRIDNNTFEVELLMDVTGEVVISSATGEHLLTLAIVIE